MNLHENMNQSNHESKNIPIEALNLSVEIYQCSKESWD